MRAKVVFLSMSFVLLTVLGFLAGYIYLSPSTGRPLKPTVSEDAGQQQALSEGLRIPLRENDHQRAATEVEAQENAAALHAAAHARQKRISDELAKKAGERGWRDAYRYASIAEIEQEIKTIEDAIYEATKDEFDYRFAAGMYEVVNEGTTYRSTSLEHDPTAVYQVRIPPGGPVQKLTLPREEFEDIYELKEMTAWLRGEAVVKRGK